MSALKRVKAVVSQFGARASGVMVDMADLRALVAMAERAEELRRRVRQYAKALSIARSLTGWSIQSDVDAQVRAALRRPLPKRGRK